MKGIGKAVGLSLLLSVSTTVIASIVTPKILSQMDKLQNKRLQKAINEFKDCFIRTDEEYSED